MSHWTVRSVFHPCLISVPIVQISYLAAVFPLLHPAHQLRSMRGIAHDIVLQPEGYCVVQVQKSDVCLAH